MTVDERRHGRWLTILLATALGFGCAQVPEGDQPAWDVPRFKLYAGGEEKDDEEITASEQRMRDQGRNFHKTVWQGVLIGAAGGTVWAILRGDDLEDTLKKAAIGGVAGGLAGAYIASKQREYATREDQLDAMITDVRQTNEETEAFIASVREVLAEDKRRLAALNADYRRGEATEEDLARQQKRVDANRQVVVDAISGGREKLAMFEGARDTYAGENPDVDATRLSSEIASLKNHLHNLDALAADFEAA